MFKAAFKCQECSWTKVLHTIVRWFRGEREGHHDLRPTPPGPREPEAGLRPVEHANGPTITSVVGPFAFTGSMALPISPTRPGRAIHEVQGWIDDHCYARLNGPAFALNPDLIERIETTPDTVITLVDGAKYVVRESVDEFVARVRESKAAIIALSHLLEHPSSGGPTLRVVPGGDSEV